MEGEGRGEKGRADGGPRWREDPKVLPELGEDSGQEQRTHRRK